MSFQRVGDGLPGMVAGWIDDDELRDRLVRSAWERAAGTTIAAKSRVESFTEGILRVRVEDPAWRKPLAEMTPELLARMRHTLGRHAPVHIVWS